jgi:CheY-like chemotaxis protein
MRPTLLLADDSVTIQRVIELTFTHEDVRVIAVSDGRQAIERINLERPDIILADVSMPHVDGYEVSSYVKQSVGLRHIPVLLLTGAFEPIDDQKMRACGCDGVLVKPFGPQELVARVRDLLAVPAAARMASVDTAAGAVQQSSAEHDASRAKSEAALELELEELDMRLAALDPAGADGANFAAQEVAMPATSEAFAVMPEPLEPPAEPVWDLTPASRPGGGATQELGPVSKVSLSSAFAALLAAEQAQPATQALASMVSEAVVEDVVRRVLERLTGDMVKTVVLDAAERLVRQEIERLKTDPEAE